MANIIVLGAGLVGSAIAKDLNKQHKVTSVDNNSEAVERMNSLYNINSFKLDLSDEKELKNIISDFDLVIGALPGFMGYQTLEWVIETGKNMIDISFMPEDFSRLDKKARDKGVIAVVDCGVAPGMGNIILGHYHQNMNIESYECYVGGLPFKREWPYEYKAVFSPIDVIEEYTRPARFIKNGELITREALSDPELLEFDEIGTLEAWNSDGLRSLIDTIKIPNMIEKTLRYPGCIEYLKVLRESGFFSYDPVDVNGMKIRPIDVTAKLLFPKWKLKEGEKDFTIMRIIIKGEKDGSPKQIVYDLFDQFEDSSKTISMARTTGYTCTAVANLILENRFTSTGVNPPEKIGAKQGHLEYVLNYLQNRNVNYWISKK